MIAPQAAAALSEALTTPRLLLRRPTATDLPALHAIFSRPEVTRHRPNPAPFTAQQSGIALETDLAHWNAWGFGRWAAIYHGRVIGFGGLTRRAGYEGLNLGYHFHPDYWGQGFASELAANAIGFGFDRLEIDRIIGLVRPGNLASMRVLEKLGMRPMGEVTSDGHPSRFFILDRVRQAS